MPEPIDVKALIQHARNASIALHDTDHSLGHLFHDLADALEAIEKEREALRQVKWSDETGEFAEGCWTEQGGIHLRVEITSKERAVLIFEAGPGGKRLAAVSIAAFRRERIAAALAAREGR